MAFNAAQQKVVDQMVANHGVNPEDYDGLNLTELKAELAALDAQTVQRPKASKFESLFSEAENNEFDNTRVIGTYQELIDDFGMPKAAGSRHIFTNKVNGKQFVVILSSGVRRRLNAKTMSFAQLPQCDIMECWTRETEDNPESVMIHVVSLPQVEAVQLDEATFKADAAKAGKISLANEMAVLAAQYAM